jgi:NAD(P)H-hydrate epimerase
VEVWGQANPALATAGTGDVLAGLCGGLLAQGAPPWDAARLAVAVHARAALAAQERNGWRTILASDLLAEIPAQLAQLARTRGTRPTR